MQASTGVLLFKKWLLQFPGVGVCQGVCSNLQSSCRFGR
jgi:hypothetical protein